MLQHHRKKSLYYTIGMNWKELMLVDEESRKAAFCLPRYDGAVYDES